MYVRRTLSLVRQLIDSSRRIPFSLLAQRGLVSIAGDKGILACSLDDHSAEIAPLDRPVGVGLGIGISMPDISKTRVEVRAPEEWKVGKAPRLSEDHARDMLPLALRMNPVLYT